MGTCFVDHASLRERESRNAADGRGGRATRAQLPGRARALTVPRNAQRLPTERRLPEAALALGSLPHWQASLSDSESAASVSFKFNLKLTGAPLGHLQSPPTRSRRGTAAVTVAAWGNLSASGRARAQ
jgi:hypothetical protein